MKFIYVSTNENKFKEISQVFPKPIILEKIELTEIQGSLEDIVYNKIEEAYQKLKTKYDDNFMIIVDDVSLEIKELNCFPGPYIKHFMKIGIPKIQKMMEPFNKNVTAFCGLGVCYKKDEKFIKTKFIGKVNGQFVFDRSIRNQNAFGFDSIFLMDNCPHTFGEMTFKEKCILSHRGAAVKYLIDFCVSENLFNN